MWTKHLSWISINHVYLNLIHSSYNLPLMIMIYLITNLLISICIQGDYTAKDHLIYCLKTSSNKDTTRYFQQFIFHVSCYYKVISETLCQVVQYLYKTFVIRIHVSCINATNIEHKTFLSFERHSGTRFLISYSITTTCFIIR
jgi:hypothetical protein